MCQKKPVTDHCDHAIHEPTAYVGSGMYAHDLSLVGIVHTLKALTTRHTSPETQMHNYFRKVLYSV